MRSIKKPKIHIRSGQKTSSVFALLSLCCYKPAGSSLAHLSVDQSQEYQHVVQYVLLIFLKYKNYIILIKISVLKKMLCPIELLCCFHSITAEGMMVQGLHIKLLTSLALDC